MDRFECLVCRPGRFARPFSPFLPRLRGAPLRLRPRPGPGPVIHEDRRLALEMFADFLPLDGIDPGLSLGEGLTPLVRWAASEGPSAGPRVMQERGPEPHGELQGPGNRRGRPEGRLSRDEEDRHRLDREHAASTAAYGARAGLDTFVLLKEGRPSRASGRRHPRPRLVAVDGDYGRLFEKSCESGNGWASCS